MKKSVRQKNTVISGPLILKVYHPTYYTTISPSTLPHPVTLP